MHSRRILRMKHLDKVDAIGELVVDKTGLQDQFGDLSAKAMCLVVVRARVATNELDFAPHLWMSRMIRLSS